MNEILLEWAIPFVVITSVVGALIIVWIADRKHDQDDDQA